MLNNVNTMRQRAIESYNIQEYNNYYTYLIPLLKHFPVTSDDVWLVRSLYRIEEVRLVCLLVQRFKRKEGRLVLQHDVRARFHHLQYGHVLR